MSTLIALRQSKVVSFVCGRERRAGSTRHPPTWLVWISKPVNQFRLVYLWRRKCSGHVKITLLFIKSIDKDWILILALLLLYDFSCSCEKYCLTIRLENTIPHRRTWVFSEEFLLMIKMRNFVEKTCLMVCLMFCYCSIQYRCEFCVIHSTVYILFIIAVVHAVSPVLIFAYSKLQCSWHSNMYTWKWITRYKFS